MSSICFWSGVLMVNSGTKPFVLPSISMRTRSFGPRSVERHAPGELLPDRGRRRPWRTSRCRRPARRSGRSPRPPGRAAGSCDFVVRRRPARATISVVVSGNRLVRVSSSPSTPARASRVALTSNSLAELHRSADRLVDLDPGRAIKSGVPVGSARSVATSSRDGLAASRTARARRHPPGAPRPAAARTGFGGGYCTSSTSASAASPTFSLAASTASGTPPSRSTRPTS